MVNTPQLLILDEPFSGLDPVNQAVLEELVLEAAKRGATVIFSTHIMQHAERLSNRLVLLSRGRKVFEGTQEEARKTLPGQLSITCRADPSKQRLLDLLQQTVDDSNDNSAIEDTFKHAPELSYKLMRLVNSVSVGLRSPIRSLSHALTILGRRQLQRWLQVLLFASHSSHAFSSSLLPMAASRGKLMELLAERHSHDRAWPDRAFMTGILSLLDALLAMPIAEVIEPLRLPDDVRTALLEREGPLGHLLRIVEALESNDNVGAAALLATGDPCSTSELPQLQIAALAWSDALKRTSDS